MHSLLLPEETHNAKAAFTTSFVSWRSSRDESKIEGATTCMSKITVHYIPLALSWNPRRFTHAIYHGNLETLVKP